mgnify:CR=1 FL=1
MTNAIKAPTDTSALFNDKSDLAEFSIFCTVGPPPTLHARMWRGVF